MLAPDAAPAAAHPAEQHPVTRRVREQYERYPYPIPPAAGEVRFAAFGALDYVQHVLWPGRRDLRGLRVLDAGCGTGDTAVYIAHRYPDVEVVGIDLSEASLEHARALARRAGVGDNLTLRRLPIEEVDALGGPFDYIVASGVLHHLADPDAGLRALAARLTPTGGLGIMVYGTYGRHAVYLMQDLLRRLVGGRDIAEQVAFTRRLLAGWSRGHPFQPGDWADLRWETGAGVVDLLLHAQDRSYTVPQLYGFLAGAGLRLERFYNPVAYRPAAYVTDPAVLRVAEALPLAEQAAVAELLHGRMAKHLFFATRASYQPVHVEPEGLVLLALRPRRSPLYDWDRAERRRHKREERLVVREFSFDFQVRTIELSPWNTRVLDHCDGERTGLEVFQVPAVYASVPGATPDEKLETFGRFLEVMAQYMALLFEP